MKYLLVCEVGPIYDFITNSRKTADYWAASFLFSYLMEALDNFVKSNNGVTFMPQVVSTKISKICGSFPDILFFIVDENNLPTIKTNLNDLSNGGIHKALNLIIKDIPALKSAHIDRLNEIHNFFNFFYIFIKMQDDSPSFDEYQVAVKQITARSLFLNFKQSLGSSLKKWDKCSLCGDRIKITSVKIGNSNDLFDHERICAVCALKRYLGLHTRSIIQANPKFYSTADIALIPVKELIKAAPDLRKDYYKIIRQCRKEKEYLNIDDFITEGAYFYDLPFNKNFKEWKKSIAQASELKNNAGLKWVKRPFYCIVYMDGDNLGKTYKENRDPGKYPLFHQNVSKIQSEFSDHVEEIIDTKYHGKLIYAAGDDVQFMIHPEYLLDCISEIRIDYNNRFVNDELTKADANKLTISTGILVSYYKFPLSEAIKRANIMLNHHAKLFNKNGKSKDAVAVLLVKGHNENVRFEVPNDLIKNIITFKKAFADGVLSNLSPYKLEEYEDVFELIKGKQARLNLLASKIFGDKISNEQVRILNDMEAVMEQSFENLMRTLLFARFLATGE